MAEAWVVETQNKLQPIISAPKLTDKLLQKPPFRFLHDIVTSFIKTTGLLGGLFTNEELNPGKEASKELKLEFLQKLVTCLQVAHDKPCVAKPVKIIAGSEPEQTNAMLVMLAGLKDLPSSKVTSAVQATLGGGGGASDGAARSSPPPQERPAERPAPADIPAAAERPQSQGGGRRPKPEASQPQPAPAQPASVPQVQAIPQQSSQDAAGGRPGTASARKPPPAVKSNEVMDDRDSISKAPQAQVIAEAKRDDETETKQANEDDWQKLVEQQEEQAKAAAGAAGAGGDGGRGGYLAKQAEQAKRDEEEAKRKAEAEAAAEGRGAQGIVLKTRKKDDRGAGSIGASEMGKLKEQLQLLTKASNPLGKFLEALHEDVDTMSRELEMWRTEAKTQTLAAADARRQTEEALREVNAKKKALDDAIAAKTAQITIVRGTILQNDKTIETLIRMVVKNDAAAAAAGSK